VEAQRAGQYLTFRIGRFDFAMNLDRVRGIVPAKELQKLEAPAPGMLRFFGSGMCGFASIRGRDFPVIDVRAKLGLPIGRRGRQPCIVAVEIDTPEGRRLAGFLADRISEIVHVRERDFHLGKLRLGGRLRVMFDPESLLAATP
jgi:chemotaxis signal transduction protein